MGGKIAQAWILQPFSTVSRSIHEEKHSFVSRVQADPMFQRGESDFIDGSDSMPNRPNSQIDMLKKMATALPCCRQKNTFRWICIKTSLASRASGKDTIPNPLEGCTYEAGSRTSSLSEAKISTRRISSRQCKRLASMCVQATLWPVAILR